MRHTPFNSLLILTLVTLVRAITIKSKATAQDIVRVRHVSSTHARRYRRDAGGQLPAEMHFNFRSRGSDVHLRLKRSSTNQPTDIPVYVIRENGVVKENLPPIQNAASYLDKVMGAAVVVEQKPDGNFSLDYIFFKTWRGPSLIENLKCKYETLKRTNGDGSYHDHAGRVQILPAEGDRHVLSWTSEVDYGQDFVLNSDESTRPYPPRAHVRTRREIVNEHTIGVLMCADYKDYSQWVNYFKNQTLVKNGMRQYYAVVAQSMSLRYASVTDVDPQLKINIHITGLLIVDNPGKSNWTEDFAQPDGTVEVRPVLRTFKNWVRTQTGSYSLPRSDHWMLFSGYDLTSNGNRVVAGLATLAAMCTQSSVSVIEQDFSASVGATASHELGHCLSAVHDGTSLAWNCPSADNYVMSSKLVNPTENATASRPWEFSSCSVRAFRDYLSRVYCVREPDSNRTVLTHSDVTDIKPGQVYSSDIQCKLALGNGSYFGRGIQYDRGFDSMCRGMYCAVPGKPRFFQKLFAMEKTTCGNGKWCLKGRCAADPEAPRTPEFCPQGDSPQEICNLQDCPFLTIEGRIGYCCKTCDTTPIRIHTLQSTVHQMSTPSPTTSSIDPPVWVQPVVTNGGSRPVSNTNSGSRPVSNTNGDSHSASNTNGGSHSASNTNGGSSPVSHTNVGSHSVSNTNGGSHSVSNTNVGSHFASNTNGGSHSASNTNGGSHSASNTNGANPPQSNRGANTQPSQPFKGNNTAFSNIRPDVFASMRGLFSHLHNLLNTNKISNSFKNSAQTPVPVSVRRIEPAVPVNNGNTGTFPAVGSLLTPGGGTTGTGKFSVNFVPVNPRIIPPADRGTARSVFNNGFSWEVSNEPVMTGNNGLFFSNDKFSKPSQGQFQSLSGWIRNQQPQNNEPSQVTNQATVPVDVSNSPQRVALTTLASVRRAKVNVQPVTGTVRHRMSKSTTSGSTADSRSGADFGTPTVTITKPANAGPFCVSCAPFWSVPREVARSAPQDSVRPDNLRNISWLRRSSVRFMSGGNVYSGVFIPLVGPRRTIG